MLTQTSSRVKMGFNYLLMERKFNFPSQVTSAQCKKSAGWGDEQKVLCKNVSELDWKRKDERREVGRVQGSENFILSGITLDWLLVFYNHYQGVNPVNIAHLALERDAPLLCLVLAVLEEVDQWLDTPVPDSLPQFIVNFIIFSRRIISSWMRH